jgi:hypothetical protein
MIGAEEYFQVDVRLLRDSPQQRRLVLNGVGNKIGEAELALIRVRSAGFCLALNRSP